MNRVRGEGGRFHSPVEKAAAKESANIKREKTNDLQGIKLEKTVEDNAISQLLTAVTTDSSLVSQVRTKRHFPILWASPPSY